jgi:hypothetical protein
MTTTLRPVRRAIACTIRPRSASKLVIGNRPNVTPVAMTPCSASPPEIAPPPPERRQGRVDLRIAADEISDVSPARRERLTSGRHDPAGVEIERRRVRLDVQTDSCAEPTLGQTDRDSLELEIRAQWNQRPRHPAGREPQAGAVDRVAADQHLPVRNPGKRQRRDGDESDQQE